MLSHHILSALYAIVFSSTVSLYSGVLASPLPLPLAFMIPEYGRLSYTRNSSATWQGETSPATNTMHHYMNQNNSFANENHSLHQRDDSLRTLVEIYHALNINGLEFLEQPTYLYNAIEFKKGISRLPALLREAGNQERNDEWLRVLQCTEYLVKITLKGTEEIIAGVIDDATLNSLVYEIKCILEEVLKETVDLTDEIINIALPLHLSLLDSTLELVWKTTCNLDDILARYV